MKAKFLVATLGLLVFSTPAVPAFSAPLDLSLRGFYNPNRQPDERIDDAAYGSLMSQIGLALGNKMVGPGQSLGALGVEAAYELSFAGTSYDAGDPDNVWKSAVASPTSTLTTGQLRVRKGLPYALQAGCVLTHIFDSNMWAIGAELNFSLIDGFVSVPDLALRLNAHTMIGHQDISMLLAGADLVLSKTFGIGGVVSLQPWGAYSFTYQNVTTRQIEVYPNDTTLQPDLMLLKAVNNVAHRAAFGVRLVVTRVSIGGEFMRSFTDDLSVFTGKIGLDF
ncbi:MAG: hypothetical protein H6747_16165 [Deltaproteobacteria bacterium]|nr:hypothetical protein [Deltaproteobacteria bacterium]